MTLKQKLDKHYKDFDRTKLKPDPLQFLHLFYDEKDIELIGFFASVFAYGNVKQIENTMLKIVDAFNGSPFTFICNFSPKEDWEKLKHIKHRFYSNADIKNLFTIVSKKINESGSFKEIFLSGYNPNDSNVKNGIENFSRFFLNSFTKSNIHITRGIQFMFPLPEKGSACKRMNLYLRWMVRRDELDTGLWNEISTSKLIIPVDTHIAKISKSLNLTKLHNVSWKMAEEITQNLKKFDAFDPVKYDFALCHIGMRKMKF